MSLREEAEKWLQEQMHIDLSSEPSIWAKDGYCDLRDLLADFMEYWLKEHCDL